MRITITRDNAGEFDVRFHRGPSNVHDFDVHASSIEGITRCVEHYFIKPHNTMDCELCAQSQAAESGRDAFGRRLAGGW
jgi:hypothetical protein